MHTQVDTTYANGQYKDGTGHDHQYTSGDGGYMFPDEKGQSTIQAKCSHGMSTGEAIAAHFNNSVNGRSGTLEYQLEQCI
ncbi:hypothetical protein D3C74_486120 [compost metagenome]